MFDEIWIKTKEQLPNEEGFYLVFTGVKIEILCWNSFHKCWDDSECDDYECDALDITHWMPLPELPNNNPNQT